MATEQSWSASGKTPIIWVQLMRHIDVEDVVNNYLACVRYISPYLVRDRECIGILDISSEKNDPSVHYLLKSLKLATKVELYKAEIGLTVTQAKGKKDIQESNQRRDTFKEIVT
jgi:hypothetical protein